MFTAHDTESDLSSDRPILPLWLVGTIALGTLLNPLNSSMIAVSLLRLGSAFHVTLGTVTWLVFLRVLQAFGTSAAYPAGLALFRAQARHATGEAVQPPAAALGTISMTSNVSAALGPALGGVLLLVANWQAIFLINIPLVVVGLVLALLLLPKDRLVHDDQQSFHPRSVSLKQAVPALDVPGVILFSGTLTSLLVFLLALPGNPPWLLLAVFVVLLLLLLFWEYRARTPFFNMSMLLSNRQLVKVYVQFAAVNVVFYSLFFGLPLWLEKARGFGPALSGLLMLPLTGVGILTTFAAIQILRQSGGIRRALFLGALALSGGTLLLLFFEPNSPVALLLAVIMVLGIPNGLQNLGLQAALYAAAPAKDMGVAAGQFQTFRYLGSILSTSLLGLLFGGTTTTGGLHLLAVALACISVLLLAGTVRLRMPGNHASRS